MQSNAIIGVLASWLEGKYISDVFTGIHEVAREHGAQMVIVRTSIESPSGGWQLIDSPPGVDRVTGWIIIGDSLEAEAIHRLRATGRPVVMVSSLVPSLDVPTILSDNKGGTAEVVHHLIDHGHTSIAFIGALYMADMRQRYEGYAQALSAHGLSVDPNLVVDVPHAWEEDGFKGVGQLLEAGQRFTAVVAGNDQNAIGVLRRLQSLGHRVPENVAVVGFDDIDEVQYFIPPLASVRQQTATLGRTAAEMLLQLCAGEAVPHGPHYIPTALIRRRSCGCEILASTAFSELARWQPEFAQPEALARQLLRLVLYPALPDERAPEEVWPGVMTLNAAVQAAVEGRRMPSSNALASVWEDAVRLTTNLEALQGIIRTLQRYGREVLRLRPDASEAGERLDTCVELLQMEMARARIGDESYRGNFYRTEIQTNSNISISLLRSSDRSVREMHWLEWTGLQWGCLGLWDGDPAAGARRELVIAGAYSADASPTPALGSRGPWSAFMPIELLAGSADARSGLAVMVPFETTTREGGVIVLMEDVSSKFINRSYTIREWVSFLVAALERESLLTALAAKQEALEQTNRQLLRAKDAAEEANHLKTQFVANMSHELRTPLNAVLNFTRFIADPEIAGGGLTSQQDYFQQRVIASAEHLLGLINDILDLAKIESGKMTIFQEQADLVPLLQGVMTTAIGLTKDKVLALELEIEEGLPRVWIDKTRIRQVMLNLLSNAAKFTEHGGITVRAKRTGDGYVQVAVTDTGIGIPADKQHLVFEEYQQVDGELTREHTGTGLGMPISRRFIELHRGRMWLESEVGVGSTFFFTVPIEAPPERTAE